MSDFDGYVDEILRGTFLTRREKSAWREEMLSHLDESIETAGVHSGVSSEDATQSVMESFGRSSEMRARIIRETFGISPIWYLSACAASFLAFVFSLFINMRVGDVIPHGLIPIPTPQWVLFAKQHFPSSSSMWAGLAVMFFMLVFTRKHADRLASGVSMFPFFVVWLIDRVPHYSLFPRTLFYSPLWGVSGPFGLSSTTGYLLVLVLSLIVYIWTRNQAVSLTSWFVSLAITLWPVVLDTVQTALWRSTKNPIFWGHYYPSTFMLEYVASSIVARLAVLGLIMYGCRKIDLMSERRSSPT